MVNKKIKKSLMYFWLFLICYLVEALVSMVSTANLFNFIALMNLILSILERLFARSLTVVKGTPDSIDIERTDLPLSNSNHSIFFLSAYIAMLPLDFFFIIALFCNKSQYQERKFL